MKETIVSLLQKFTSLSETERETVAQKLASAYGRLEASRRVDGFTGTAKKLDVSFKETHKLAGESSQELRLLAGLTQCQALVEKLGNANYGLAWESYPKLDVSL